VPPEQLPSDVYYHREVLVHSLDRRRVDLVTVSSTDGIMDQVDSTPQHLMYRNVVNAYSGLC
jgi:capsule polysaccharide modification protein KpsS